MDSLFNSLRWLTETAEAFASGVKAKLDQTGRWMFGGRRGPFIASDQALRFKDMLANAALFDRELLVRTTANPAARCDFSRPWLGWLLGRRARVAMVVAVDLAEVIRRAAGPSDSVDATSSRVKQRQVEDSPRRDAPATDWPALSAEGLEAALADYRDTPRHAFVGVCSPSGFSDAAVQWAARRAAEFAARGGGLVLVAPRPDGGWRLIEPGKPPPSGRALAQPWHFAFDPEPIDDKIERVSSAVRSADFELSESGLSDRELSDRLEVPVELVRQVFEAEAGREPGLRVRQLDGDQVLLGSMRSAAGLQERNTSMFDKLKELLRLGGQEERKIQLLADKRALLSSRRDRLYRELDELVEREGALKRRGVEADSAVVQRRIASELAQVRRRIDQGNSLVSLVNQQINVLSTHIHHLTLITQGQTVDLPDAEEMTRDAVRAEELIERVKADAELVESLAQATGATLTSKSEEDIMAEFAAARKEAPAAEPVKDQPLRQQAPPQTTAQQQPDQHRQERDRPLKE